MSELQRLLVDGIRFDPHYLPSMNSDHMPMTLCAMSALGASEQALRRYRDDYSRILRLLPAATPLEDWRTGLGSFDHYASLLEYFQIEISRRGVQDPVRDVLLEVMPSLAFEAFHPIIRTAYGIDFGCTAEVAAGLSSLVCAAVPVPIGDEPIELAASLQRQAVRPDRGATSGRFGEGLNLLLADGNYPTGRAGSLSECASVALDAYRSTRNFFALHLVTATQAVRVCAPFAGDALALRALTGALLAAHRVLGSPLIDSARVMPAPKRLDREHCYKYVYACLSEYRVYRDPRYLDEILSFRAAGLVDDWVVTEFDS